MKTFPTFRAAACHAAPCYFDTPRTIDKACALIAEAAQHGAELVAFPEAFVSAFPVWSGVYPPVDVHRFFFDLAAGAVEVDGPEVQRLRAAARRHGVFVSIGVNEVTPVSPACIWDTNLLIGDDGRLLNRHRKLVPTYWEKMTWANGDGSGLRVVDTRIGKLGALVCGENTNSLARFALLAQGENVHVSSFSPRWPTHPPGEAGYDLEAAIRLRAGAHAFEGKVFNIVASGFLPPGAIDLIARDDARARQLLEESPKSVSMIFGPDGRVISDTLRDDEGIVYADIDLAKCVIPKQFQDVVGYYNRFDVFRLSVDRRPLRAAEFGDGAAAHASAGVPDDALPAGEAARHPDTGVEH
ncbi:carbon-nitrogen hydrolase family protein [Burkholderia ubonensis]|uniref:Aliphatic nitrilase n=1 Tax=Burkholderia ubonensis TaxID=101571 RepID=A0A108EKS6_9BURK|nr:carbon-nitrogen hydrolase family protein [Burkholderia ubonensis]KVS39097.1 aliphatic nitrilase [Burkholderia ubonensis]KVS46548.1 aliphatic nitrilase [Burkholderia ubonensis]KVS83964.1 aliphatic nitrilase [Burkholderia ubonensis]KVS92692.1 aliphatic nitrilase [Burkholderia ubonensis]KVS93312.1 aliphatic nitrilase [Burkholderia ubonensis]